MSVGRVWFVRLVFLILIVTGCLQAINIWDERRGLSSRGHILKEDFMDKQPGNSDINKTQSNLKLKQPVGDMVDKIILDYEIIIGGELDEEALLSRCTTTHTLEKIVKDFSNMVASANMRRISSFEALESATKDEDWWDNDGALNTISMMYPRFPIEHPHRRVTNESDCRPLQPGLWYYNIIEGDHIMFIINRERAGVEFDLIYDSIFERCRKHAFRKKPQMLPNQTQHSVTS